MAVNLVQPIIEPTHEQQNHSNAFSHSTAWVSLISFLPTVSGQCPFAQKSRAFARKRPLERFHSWGGVVRRPSYRRGAYPENRRSSPTLVTPVGGRAAPHPGVALSAEDARKFAPFVFEILTRSAAVPRKIRAVLGVGRNVGIARVCYQRASRRRQTSPVLAAHRQMSSRTTIYPRF